MTKNPYRSAGARILCRDLLLGSDSELNCLSRGFSIFQCTHGHEGMIG